MRLIQRILALLLMLLMLAGTALAEAPFLRHSEGWALENTPLEVYLSADITALLPYDDDRFAMLKEITDNLSLRLIAAPDEGSVSIYVSNSEALTLAYLDDAVQLSCVPETAFTADSDPMGLLLGASTQNISLYGLRADAEALLNDGWVLLSGISPAFDEYADRRSVKTAITDMGTARSCTDYTIPKGDVEAMKETLLSLCPEGWLHDIIAGLTFSGKQTLRVYRTEDEVPLRMEYNGTCGPEGNLRTVKLVWRMRRDDTAHRDEVTLTSPAKSGGNKNTLEFERIIKTNKSGAIEMDGSFTYTVVLDKQTTTRKGEFELTNACTEESDVITGTVKLQQKLPGEDSFTGVSFAPNLTIAGSQDDPAIHGTLEVSGLSGKNVAEHAMISVRANRAEESLWTAREETMNLSVLTPEQLASVQQQVAAKAATALVRPLIILLGDTADWFFRDMAPEDVEAILDAAGSVTIIE
ncbi:MAG: hypothetical protein IJ438_04565 [Clostridia bacterium]|nr:hypothetical protein [Clostridia bacterium]